MQPIRDGRKFYKDQNESHEIRLCRISWLSFMAWFNDHVFSEFDGNPSF